MKYIPLRDLQLVTDALNFSTADCHVLGSCDLYTTKAAGSDKKLYKSIENSLESQHESLVRLSASLSPPQIPADGQAKERSRAYRTPEIDLSRDSPFGPLSQISARRTFAYLIATLNASHPDYEFSNHLRPSDFRKTTGTTIKRAVDSTLHSLRPRRMISLLQPPARAPLSNSAPTGVNLPSGEVVWSEQMWEMIDNEMDLRRCEKYTWDPRDDPFESEGALWTQHHFFFNKDKKRVCYLNFRAFSIISHSPVTSLPVRSRSESRSKRNVSVGEGAGKRAQYWLGHSIKEDEVQNWPEDDDDEGGNGNDSLAEEEYMDDIDDIRQHLEDGRYSLDDDSDVDDASGWYARHRSVPHGRSGSESIADAMEI